MAKQTFSVGQTLTAAQMTSLQQTAMLGGAASAKTASYTLVAADAGGAISMSSASATTITVNTALFAAGDTVHITNLGAGVCTITAGTATVNSSASLALAQYESGFLDFTSTSAAIFVKGAGAAAASGGITLISETVASGLSSLSLSSIPNTYKDLTLTWHGIVPSGSGSNFGIRFNNDSTAGAYQGNLQYSSSTSVRNVYQFNTTDATNAAVIDAYPFGQQSNNTSTDFKRNPAGSLTIFNYASTTKLKFYEMQFYYVDVNNTTYMIIITGTYNSTSAITSLDVYRYLGSDTFSNATNTSIRLYGNS
jgi:hypothetical protein